jgi:hypothetical protein
MLISSLRLSEEANKKVGLTYVDAFNRGDEAVLRTLFTEDALIYGVLATDNTDRADGLAAGLIISLSEE